jgi:RNA polymerase sigma-70 factor (ECF subfamily)
VQELALPMTDIEDGPPEASELAEIVRRAKAGDPGAFEQIILRHERLVFRIALRLLGHVEDAEDAAQDVFLKLHKHLRRLDDTRAFSPWLYKVTLNACRDIASKRKRDQGVSLENIKPPAAPQEKNLEDERRIVALGLKRLPQKERAALVLRDIEGLPTAEVARVLGSSEATVRSQICSARLKIKRFADGFQGRTR